MDPGLMQRTRYLLGVGVGIKNALATRRIAREGERRADAQREMPVAS